MRPVEGITLCVVAHAPYLKFLPECLKAWDAQVRVAPCRKVLVLDDCSYDPPEGWEVVSGRFGHPGPARNAGLQVLANESWVIYWDADNVPSPMFMAKATLKAFKAKSDVGVISGDVAVDLRDTFGIDTGSCWRVNALLHVGGWPGVWLEDWTLGRRLQAAGWKMEPLGIAFDVRKHEEQRSLRTPLVKKLHSCREVGIVTLLRGDLNLSMEWCNAVFRQAKRRKSLLGLTVVIPRGNAQTVDDVKSMAYDFDRLTIIRVDDDLQQHMDLSSALPRAEFVARHSYVSRLYSKAIAATPEDVIFTWEDDVIPTTETAMEDLVDTLLPNRGLAAVCGVYPARHSPGQANLSVIPDVWRMPDLDELRDDECYEVGMVSGGFTAWSRAALEEHPILSVSPMRDLGWDGFVSQRMVSEGQWTLLVNGAVRCDHLT